MLSKVFSKIQLNRTLKTCNRAFSVANFLLLARSNPNLVYRLNDHIEAKS